MTSSTSFFQFLHCLCLVPYLIVCFCLFLLGFLEWIVRQYLLCTSFHGSELLCCRMRNQLARHFGVSGICNTVYQGLVRVICPSVIMRECEEFQKYVEEGDKEVKEMMEEIATCNAMLQSLRHERHQCRKLWESSILSSPEPINVALTTAVADDINRNASDSKQIEAFLTKSDQCQRLQNHLETLRKNAEDRRISSQTRATAEKTGYHGIVDWAEKTYQTHDTLLQATAQVAFVGAGLTYGSIFSASRGNIGLMCYAFALFDCGFIIPTVALALLKWASSRPKDTLFCSPHSWTLFLNVFTYVSVAAVGAAICLLNMTLIFLVFPLDPSGQRKDAVVELNISPTPAGKVSLSCLTLAVVIVFICSLAHYMTRGKDAFFYDFIGHRKGVEAVA